MVKETVEQLCKQHTELSSQDVQILQEMAFSLQTYADLSDAYMFIDCKMKESEQAIVVAEAFPKSVDESVYENSVVGKIVFDSFEPGVFYSYRNGKEVAHRAGGDTRRYLWKQTVVPIKNKSHQVIGVLIQEKEVYSTDFKSK